MANKRMTVIVRGDQHTWGFSFTADPKHIAEWRADGLEVDEVVNAIPEWAVRLGLAREWVAIQDVLNFRLGYLLNLILTWFYPMRRWGQ